MQKILIALLTITTTVGAWLAYNYHDQLASKDAQIATLTAERDKARAGEKAALAALDPLNENIARLTRERDRLQAMANRPPEFPPGGPMPPPGGPNGGPPTLEGMMAMFKTAAGKKMLHNQSTSMVRMQYAALAKKMNLSPQDSTVLMGLLADRQTALASARLSSGGDPAQTAAQISAVESEFGDKIKATLGEEGYGQFTEYEKSAEEQGAVSMFEDQFSSAGIPLDGTQKESLVQVMASEREKSEASPFDPTKNDPNTVLTALKDDATFSAWEKQQADYQNRVLQSASKTLTPDQVNTLRQVMEQKTEQQKNGLQIFKTTGVPPPPPPTK